MPPCVSHSPLTFSAEFCFGSWDDHFHAIDRKTGQRAWAFKAGGAIVGSAALHDGKLLFGSRDNSVYCITATDGKVLWKKPIRDASRKVEANANGPWVESPAAVGAYTCPPTGSNQAPVRFFIGAHDREMHAFDPATGVEEWRFPTFNWILSRPAVANYTVYFGSLDGRIYAVDARCGAVQWIYQTGARVRYGPCIISGTIAGEGVSGSPLYDAGTLYCGGDDGFMYALDAATGQEKWVFQTRKWISSRPLVAGSALVVASSDGSVYGLDISSGRQLWRTETGNANYADVVGFNKLALIACTNGRLFAIEPSTGKVTWAFDADAPLRAAPAVDPDGTIYLPSIAGTIYALRGVPN